MKMKRVFLIVLDSFGIGEMPDAAEYGDKGTNTIASVAKSPFFSMKNMKEMGLFNIDGVTCGEKVDSIKATIARMKEKSKGFRRKFPHERIVKERTEKAEFCFLP